MLEQLLKVIDWQAEDREDLDGQLMRLLLLARSRNLDIPALLQAIFTRDPAAAVILARRFAAQSGGPQSGEYLARLEACLRQRAAKFAKQGWAETGQKNQSLPGQDLDQPWMLIAAAVGLERQDLVGGLLRRCPEPVQSSTLTRTLAEINRLPGRLDAFLLLMEEAEQLFSPQSLSYTLKTTAYLYDLPDPKPPRLISLARRLMEKKQLLLLKDLATVIKSLNLFEVPGISPQSICQAALYVDTVDGYLFSQFMLCYMQDRPQEKYAVEKMAALEQWWSVIGNCQSPNKPWVDLIYFSRRLFFNYRQAGEILAEFPRQWEEGSYSCGEEERLPVAKMITAATDALLRNTPKLALVYLKKIQGFNVFARGGGVEPYSYRPHLRLSDKKTIIKLKKRGMERQDIIWLYMNSHLRATLSGMVFLDTLLWDPSQSNKNPPATEEQPSQPILFSSQDLSAYPLYINVRYKPATGRYKLWITNLATPIKVEVSPAWRQKHDAFFKSLVAYTGFVCRLEKYNMTSKILYVTDLVMKNQDDNELAGQFLSILEQAEKAGRFTLEQKEQLAALAPLREYNTDNGWQLYTAIIRALASCAQNDPVNAMDLLTSFNKTGANYFHYESLASSILFPCRSPRIASIRQELRQLWNKFWLGLVSRRQMIQIYFHTAFRTLPLAWLIGKCFPPQLRAGDWADLGLLSEAMPNLSLYCKVMSTDDGQLFALPAAIGRGGCNFYFDEKFRLDADLKKDDVCICRPVAYDFSQGICYLDGFKKRSAPGREDRAAMDLDTAGAGEDYEDQEEADFSQ